MKAYVICVAATFLVVLAALAVPVPPPRPWRVGEAHIDTLTVRELRLKSGPHEVLIKSDRDGVSVRVSGPNNSVVLESRGVGGHGPSLMFYNANGELPLAISLEKDQGAYFHLHDGKRHKYLTVEDLMALKRE